MRTILSCGLFLAAAAAADLRCQAAETPEEAHPAGRQTASQPGTAVKWQSLFDGRTLRGWAKTAFGGEGDVLVEDSAIVLEFGSSMTGITYQGELPQTNYEIELEARRLDGVDFFCGLTFPVGQSHCSFIVGGWAGSVVGLSSIDGKDASENATTRLMSFKTGQWYKIRVRVTPSKIQAWIDDRIVVDQSIEGKRISTRVEVDLSKPLGISAWETKAALRKIRLRRIADR